VNSLTIADGRKDIPGEITALSEKRAVLTDDRRAGEQSLESRFETLLKEHWQMVYNFALRLSGSTADAEDLVSESVVRAYGAFGKFRLGSNFRAWICQIVYNLHIDQVRKKGRNPRVVSLDESPGDVMEGKMVATVSDSPQTPERTVIGEVMEEDLQTALMAISEEQRAAITLVDVGDMSYDEAAEALRIPVGTVRSRLFRARQSLKQLLEAGVKGRDKA